MTEQVRKFYWSKITRKVCAVMAPEDVQQIGNTKLRATAAEAEQDSTGNGDQK